MESDEGSWEAVRLYTKLEGMFITARLTDNPHVAPSEYSQQSHQ